jgi:hypothetical protein
MSTSTTEHGDLDRTTSRAQRRVRRRAAKALTSAVAMTAGFISATTGVADAAPTCSHLGIENHGQHVVGDYVTGVGGLDGTLAWPPKGAVGSVVGATGPAVPGGPGPGFHFVHGFAPGASFCVDSQSPGMHLLDHEH